MGLTLKRLVDGLRAVFTAIFREKHEIREFEKDPIREDCVGVMDSVIELHWRGRRILHSVL